MAASSSGKISKVSKEATSTKTKCAKAEKDLKALKQKREAAIKDMEELKSTFVDVDLLISQLNKINYQAPRSLRSRIKATSFEELTDVAGELAEFEDVLGK